MSHNPRRSTRLDNENEARDGPGVDIVFDEFSYCVMSPFSHLPLAVGNCHCWLRGLVSQNVEYVCLTRDNAYMFLDIMTPINLSCGVYVSHPSPPKFSQPPLFIFQLISFFLNHQGTWRATLSVHSSLQIHFNCCLRHQSIIMVSANQIKYPALRLILSLESLGVWVCSHQQPPALCAMEMIRYECLLRPP